LQNDWIFYFIFQRTNRGLVHEPWTTSSPGPQWTGHGQRHRAHQSFASGRSGAQGRRPRGGRGGVGRGEPNCPLTGASEAVRRPGYGGEGGGGRNSGAGHAQAQRVGNGEGMSAVRRGRAPRPLMAIQFGGEGKRRG
jgi:hypothetical protein